MPNGRSPFDLSNPVTLALANNNMGPAGSYIYRKYWQQNMMPPDPIDLDPVDIWYKKLFWGRVSGNGTVIYPSETNLKQIPDTKANEAHWALDFVVDAYTDLATHFKQALSKGMISADSNVTSLLARRAWVSVHKSYGSYMENVYDHLVTFWFQKEQRNSKIANFADFLQEFMELVNDASNIMPFTKSSFILSRYFSPLSSGLIIENSLMDHGVDEVKEKIWLDDPNFEFYRKSAENFGFLVDKNAPWRLVADINSYKMRQYMETYDVTPEDLFDTYYYPCHQYDIENLKIYLSEMYNAYVNSYPKAKVFRTKLKGAGGVITTSRLINRRPTSIEDVNQQFRPEFWLKTYYYIRLRELGQPRDPVKFNKKLKRIFEQYKMFDFSHALDYINDGIRRIKVH